MNAFQAFDDFFASDQEEEISPFLKPLSRGWGKNLALRSSFLAGFFLAASFFFSFYSSSVSFIFLIGVYFLVGTKALIDSIHDIIKLKINIEVLMTLAALLSVLIGSGLEGGLLLVLFELSSAMEGLVHKKTRSSILTLHKISPRTAFVVEENGDVYETALGDVTVGTKILIKAGEIVPLDGIVVSGRSDLNLVHLTGESVPLSKTVGDEVPAGAGNLDGTLTIVVTRSRGDSTISRILRLIIQAQASKPHVQQFLDRFGKYYATTIIGLFFLFAWTLPWIIKVPYLGHEGAIYRALAFLIAASPCALIIATPTAYLSAISCCVRRGIVPKGGVVLDALACCKAVAIDKTGTLTTGTLVCTAIEHVTGPITDKKRALSVAASLERHAVHPISRAIVAKAKSQNIEILPVEKFIAIPGSGLEGVVDSVPSAIGHLQFIQGKTAFTFSQSGFIASYLWIDGSIFVLYFTDTIRSSAKKMVESLKKLNLKIIILSGDRHCNVEPVAKKLEIHEFFADLRPEDKLKKIEEIVHETSLMMIGDGINDAPALARATVGISMGKMGSATAIEASDIIFINDDISLLDWLYKKALKTRRILRENITMALCVIIFASLPSLFGWIPLWLAVILHEGGTVCVGCNSLRLLKK
jgi:Zn2+/Cd2+-exporting ATPase